MELHTIDGAAIIHMTDGENKVTSEFIDSFHKILDVIENMKDVKYLVTVGEGKYFSTGVNLETLKLSQTLAFANVLSDLQRLLSRLLVFPVITIAAINGHCVGAGAMLALAHDVRVMCDGHGWFFVPIVRLGHTLPVGLLKLVKSKVSQPYAHQLLIGSVRFSADAGHKAGIIHEVTQPNELYKVMHEVGKKAYHQGHQPSRVSLSNMKESLYYDLYQTLLKPLHYFSNL